MGYRAGFLVAGGIALFAAEEFANLREYRQRGSLADGDEIVGASEIVPDERFHVGFDDDFGLLAPRQIGVALHYGKRTADDVGGGARVFEAARFEIHGDDNVRTEE